PRAATDARARGKLIPQRIAPGNMTQMPRIRSSWNWNFRSVEIDGLMGQNGSDAPVAYAAHARATQSPTCVHPSAMRGLLDPRATAAPKLLPIPRPVRNTARPTHNGDAAV